MVSIRSATRKDAELVAYFVHALLDELSGGKPPPMKGVVKVAEATLSEPSVVAALAYANGEPVGVMILNECTAIYAGGKFGEISELYVHPDMRSKGIAQQLLIHAQREAHARRWKRIEVGAPSQPEWHRTLDFYTRNGFAEVGPRLRRLM